MGGTSVQPSVWVRAMCVVVIISFQFHVVVGQDEDFGTEIKRPGSNISDVLFFVQNCVLCGGLWVNIKNLSYD